MAVAHPITHRTDPPASETSAWIHGRRRDIALSLAWVPFAIPPLLIRGDVLLAYMGAVLLWSFCHQPLTALMVYGDPSNFALKKRLFIASPFVFAAAIVIGVRVSLSLVAAVGGLWNAEHTLMQRYGVTRIYGRKAGDDQGRIEKLMLFSWLGFALVFAAADPRTPELLDRSGLAGTNKDAVEILASMSSIALILAVPMLVAVVVIVWKWWQVERTGSVNYGKRQYLGSTAALFVMIMIHPIAGVAGYVGSHALEYFVIVNRSFGSRYREVAPTGRTATSATDAPTGGVLGRLIRRLRRPRFFMIYGVAAMALAFVIDASFAVSPDLWAILFFGFGGMHVFYDGFIWKLRQPTVARSLDIAH